MQQLRFLFAVALLYMFRGTISPITLQTKTTYPEIRQYPYQWQQPTIPKNTQGSNPFPHQPGN